MVRTVRHVGIDVGGTSIKAGVVDQNGERIAHKMVPTVLIEPTATGLAQADTSRKLRGERLLDRLADLARELCGPNPTSLGIGVPGLVEHTAGRVETSPNVPDLAGVALASGLGERLGLESARIHVDNDANVAALGEAWLGAMAGVTDGLMVTLGTGIGGGLVLNGRPFLGAGMAGEPGHLIVEPDGLECPCGSRGCLETLASASAASRRARELGLPGDDPGNLERLTQIALAGTGPEADLCRAIGRDLGHGLALVVTLLDVRTFVIGGGFSPAFPALEAGIREGISERTFGARVDSLRVVAAKLGADAGWIGAARLAALANGGD